MIFTHRRSCDWSYSGWYPFAGTIYFERNFSFRMGIFKCNQTNMKKLASITLLLAGTLFSRAIFAQKGLDGMIKAEKDFAVFTETHSIREGFLAFMDSAGLVFKEGKPVNAWDNYRKQSIAKTILSWAPDFAVTSAGGTMGVTGGNYKLYTDRSTGKPVAKGSFSSVWKMNTKGEWKNIADLGTGYPEELVPDGRMFAQTLDEKNYDASSFVQVRMADSILNVALAHHTTAILQNYLANETRLQQNGQLPVTGINKVMQSLLMIPPGITMQSLGGGISPEGDFAYHMALQNTLGARIIICVPGYFSKTDGG